MNALQQPHALPVALLASPVYWRDPAARGAAMAKVKAELERASPVPLDFHIVVAAEQVRDVAAALKGRAGVLLPMSGGVQPWMVDLARSLRHVGLANAYLPGFLTPALGAELLDRNAHPACTDFFAFQRRAGRPARWLATVEELHTWGRANQAVQRLRAARILKIGETEPWVINSAREPARFREALGCTIVPVALEDLYREFRGATDGEGARSAEDWLGKASALAGLAQADVVRATRVLVAMRRLLERHGADALSMACFAMIGELETTSCLALSTLNDSADAIGACEGDLDAAVTLYLLKALGADFVWIANPIVHAANCVDLAHCTAPRCAGGGELGYRLLRHHESGRGVAPEVALPAARAVTLVRIGADLSELCVHPGRTERVAKQPTCHTQIRVQIPSSRAFLDTLNGTHVVMTYGDRRAELALCADLLGLKLTGAASDPESPASLPAPAPLPVCACAGAAPAPQLSAT